MTNYAPELPETSENIRQLTEEIYPTVNLDNTEDVDTYDELLKEAQVANEESFAPAIEAHTNQIEQIRVKKIGDESAKVAMQQARIEQQQAAAQTINESVKTAYDNYKR